jgi:hypothetical protein
LILRRRKLPSVALSSLNLQPVQPYAERDQCMSTPLEVIEVKSLVDRVAYTDATGSKRIPTDQFIQVRKTPWITNLIERHGDIEVKGNVAATAANVAIAAPKK